jgi:Ni,Fe-hydrogenase III small subunit
MYIINVVKEVLTKFWWKKLEVKKIKPESVNFWKKAPALLRKSLSLKCINVWWDDWIMAELYSLEWPRYSLESYNISFTVSPKHADGILVVWAVSKNMEKVLKDTYSIIPEPKIIIACWDKAINWDSRFWWIVWWVKDVLWEVDLEIPWNPRSKDIFNYLVNFVK